MRDNTQFWRNLHDRDYFGKHKLYANGWTLDDVALIQQFVELHSYDITVIIGSGQGRECRALSPLVRFVFGIEVDRSLLDPLRDLPNFIGVQADHFEHSMPAHIDLVYSVAVMQHLTRDWVRRYLLNLGTRLAYGGSMVIQFMEHRGEGARKVDKDAHLDTYEPRVSWTRRQIRQLAEYAGLRVMRIITTHMKEDADWHFVLLRRKRNDYEKTRR